jgi:hypothetical protein
MAASFDGEKRGGTHMNHKVLRMFEKELEELIKDLFDTNVPFHHKNREEPCRFCDPEAFL